VFTLPFIIITLLFIIISDITSNSIKSYYYNNMKKDALTFAKSYSHSLSKTAEATDVVNELLEQKMLVASRVTALYDGRYSNELLADLANTLEVDEIDYYNSGGEVIYSNISEIIGWQAFSGHPVHDFMIADNQSSIGDIRQDSVTGNYYKYGYFKVSDGFVQIGVKADKIYQFLGSFEMQHLLDEMKSFGVVDHVGFIDNDLSVNGFEPGAEIDYRVYEPIYLNGTPIGTLAVSMSLADTEATIKKASIIGAVALIIIYASLLYTIFSIYRKNEKLRQLAYYDPLTNLPNKQYLKAFINDELTNKETNKALLLINCINFNTVNLSDGYEYGDELLKEVTERLYYLLGDNKIIFRFLADKFVLYVKNYNHQQDLISMANDINQVFSEPLMVKGTEQYLNVQVGIVEINDKYHHVDRLLKDASISLSYIKNNDVVNYSFFNEAMESNLHREDLIEKELRAIIVNNDSKKLYLEFQPQVDLTTNKIICFEALARMRSESLGFISPLEFIDVAERKQLIVPLGNLILKTACQFICALKDEGYGDIKVAVNVSGFQLLRDDFTNTVLDIIAATNIEESNLELEITESVLLDNYEIINQKLKTLRENKISIALDDFGTGYSSLSRLRELNIDIAKIDRYFISSIPIKEQKELLTGDIISMVHKLGLTALAEGVEVEKQKDYLIEHYCDIMQGYLFSKPLPQQNAIELLKENNLKI
jgi:diguanylate cyclase (GGDEF)-like protein